MPNCWKTGSIGFHIWCKPNWTIDSIIIIISSSSSSSSIISSSSSGIGSGSASGSGSDGAVFYTPPSSFQLSNLPCKNIGSTTIPAVWATA